jgi:hypothetical protein
MSDIEKAIGNAIELMHETSDEKVHETLYEIICAAQELKEEKAERDNPKPLTLEELKERIGKPKYVVSLLGRFKPNWMLGEPTTYLPAKEYGKTWLAYDYEPKTK